MKHDVTLDELVGAVQTSLPEQQAELAALKRKHAMIKSQVDAQVYRPSTYAGELALTSNQRTLKGFMQVSDIRVASQTHSCLA